ncbi:MAG: membrane protein insertase YidC [Elusimicrobia bacterium]|nr:membrane protein insertase YidC [Elusimicrobiota bacterium]
MQKNLVLAVVLSSLVYIFWYSYMEKKAPPQGAASSAVSSQTQTAQNTSASAYSPQAALPQAAGELPADWKKDALQVKLGKAEYSLHPAGASIKSLVYEGPVAPIEMVLSPEGGLFSSFEGLTFSIKNKSAQNPEFSARTPQGVTIVKKFILNGPDKINSIEITASNSSSKPAALAPWTLSIGPGLGTAPSEQKENPKLTAAKYTFQEQGKKHPTVGKIKEDTQADNWVWAGVDNRYFLTAIIGGDFAKDRLLYSQVEVKGNKLPRLAIPFGETKLAPGAAKTWKLDFYAGPKDYALLKKLGMGLDRAVDFGFFAPLAKLADASLGYFYRLTGNYGAAIIILSVIIQLMLSPLSIKSFKSMALMKKIQPEMQEIQKRYKEDPKRMNQEVMDLYKRHGTNPLSGCLPMILQIPVFFALFTALRNSWNLHGAPFIFWIKDLSAKDPYYVLPLVMGAVMFLQQHLNPQTGDPAQAKMMKWMPVIFTFMFLSFPSGLVMYWLINSLWGFAQSMYLQKKMA